MCWEGGGGTRENDTGRMRTRREGIECHAGRIRRKRRIRRRRKNIKPQKRISIMKRRRRRRKKQLRDKIPVHATHWKDEGKH